MNWHIPFLGRRATAEPTTPPSLVITETARKELNRLGQLENSFLRIWVESGGCAGMTYSAGFDDTKSTSDSVVYNDGELRVISDPRSLPHLEGLEIDYNDDLIEAGFRFTNPGAKTSCGCGSSFGA